MLEHLNPHLTLSLPTSHKQQANKCRYVHFLQKLTIKSSTKRVVLHSKSLEAKQCLYATNRGICEVLIAEKDLAFASGYQIQTETLRLAWCSWLWDTEGSNSIGCDLSKDTQGANRIWRPKLTKMRFFRLWDLSCRWRRWCHRLLSEICHSSSEDLKYLYFRNKLRLYLPVPVFFADKWLRLGLRAGLTANSVMVKKNCFDRQDWDCVFYKRYRIQYTKNTIG